MTTNNGRFGFVFDAFRARNHLFFQLRRKKTSAGNNETRKCDMILPHTHAIHPVERTILRSSLTGIVIVETLPKLPRNYTALRFRHGFPYLASALDRHLHILGWLDAVAQSPQSKKPPNHEELKPHQFQNNVDKARQHSRGEAALMSKPQQEQSRRVNTGGEEGGKASLSLVHRGTRSHGEHTRGTSCTPSRSQYDNGLPALFTVFAGGYYPRLRW